MIPSIVNAISAINSLGWIREDNPIGFPGLGLELNPPKGFYIGSFQVHFYGVIIALGLVLAVVYGLKRCRQFGLKQDDILDGVLWIAPLSVVCARLYYCAFELDRYLDNPISILYIWEGGIAIYGAVIGAAIGVIIFSKIKKVRLAAVLDLVAISFLIGQFIGRWGNFMNREAHGGVTDFFLRMDIVSAKTGIRGEYHPTFLYESLWNVIGFVLLHFLSKKRKYDGQMALGYVAWYGLGRTFIEGMRTDSLYVFKNQLGEVLRVSQLLAAVSCITAVVILVWKHFSPPRKPLFVTEVEAGEQPPVIEPETPETEE